MNHIRRGRGRPLLLIHGLGGTWQSWSLVLDALAAEREVVAVDLPGFGDTPPPAAGWSVAALADAVSEFIVANDLVGVDAVGSSMGGRLVLELVRRGGLLGAVVSLGPGGFGNLMQRHFFYDSLWGTIIAARGLNRAMPWLMRHTLTRAAMLAQFSARSWKLPAEFMLTEIRAAAASKGYDPMLWRLAFCEAIEGTPRGTVKHPLVIGWGRYDHVSFPSQAKRCLELFPDARLHWFENCGHLPHWDVPEETVKLILSVTGGTAGGG